MGLSFIMDSHKHMRNDGLVWHAEIICMQNELVHDLSKKHPLFVRGIIQISDI
jgi:hypothetical protein